jgi:hypothetical protein
VAEPPVILGASSRGPDVNQSVSSLAVSLCHTSVPPTSACFMW